MTNVDVNSVLRRVVERAPFRRGLVTNCSTYHGDMLVDSHAYAYDAGGRPVSRNTDVFGYNDRDEVTFAAIGTNVFTHTHDYRHRRIRKTIQHYDLSATEWITRERHDFVWDGWNPVLETVATVEGVSTNVTEIQYFWGLDLSNTLQGAGGVGGLLAVSRNGSFYFPVYDNNGNVIRWGRSEKYNCQDYAQDLRTEYYRLNMDLKVLCKCGLLK